MKNDRRRFLITGISMGAAPWLAITPLVIAGEEASDKERTNEPTDEGISAPEDLMREHGVLNRVLLIYEEGLRRLRAKESVPPEVFHKPATLIRKFVEDYHERNEENFIFPEFEKQKQHSELVRTLRQQHEAGRKLTDVVLRNATGDQFVKPDSRQEIIRGCDAFIRMYRPHEAREDTVLFPALYKLISTKQIAELGEQFEEKEHQLLGSEGFEKAVDEVAAVEKQLGIYDLSKFTPKF
jgi:hemerythrin-like domain-containing protein